MTPSNPLDSGKQEPRVVTKDHGDRTMAGSNYGDYVPPPERAHVQSALPDPALPVDVAPEDPDAELIKARKAQQATRERNGGDLSRQPGSPQPESPEPESSIEGESEAGEEDPGAADEVLRGPSSGPEGVAPRH